MATSDDRFDALERLMRTGFEAMNTRFEGLSRDFAELRHEFGGLRHDFGARIDLLANYVRLTDPGYFKMGDRIMDLEQRVERLEAVERRQ